MQFGSMVISNYNNALHVSDAFCVHPQEHLETVVAASGVWHESLSETAHSPSKHKDKHGFIISQCKHTEL